MHRDSATYDFDMVRFGGPTTVLERAVTIATAVPTKIVEGDPDRVELYVTNNSTNVLRWSTKSTLTATTAQQLGAGQTLLIQLQNDGALTGWELYGLMDTADGPINVLIVRRIQRGPR